MLGAIIGDIVGSRFEFRKTTNLQREFFMYEDLIAHYPDHPKRSEWENERNELERIIRAQEK